MTEEGENKSEREKSEGGVVSRAGVKRGNKWPKPHCQERCIVSTSTILLRTGLEWETFEPSGDGGLQLPSYQTRGCGKWELESHNV